MVSTINNKPIVVMVVEDEALIRVVLIDALLDDGFEVIEASHAQEAVAKLQAEASRVHALFTDVQMPGDMDGVALAHHARTHWPWLSLLVTSGRIYPKASELPTGARFIAKPYQTPLVIRHIREMRAAA